MAVPVRAHALEYAIRQHTYGGRKSRGAVSGRTLSVSIGAAAVVSSVERDYSQRAAALVHAGDAICPGAGYADSAVGIFKAGREDTRVSSGGNERGAGFLFATGAG